MKKKYVMLFLLVIILAAGGCGGSGGGVPESAGGRPSLALLGTIGEEDRQRLEAGGISLYHFDNDASDPDDHPAFLIASDAWDEIGGDPVLMEELSVAYTDGRGKWGRIVLLRPDDDDIDRLTELQDHSFELDIHEGDSGLFYGIGRQADGDYMIYSAVDSSQSPVVYEVSGDEAAYAPRSDDSQPEPEDAVSADTFAQSCENLREWLLAEEDNREARSADVNAGRNAAPPNLHDLATNWKATMYFAARRGNTFIINNFITAVHHFADENNSNGGSDLYYVEQECILQAGKGYENVYRIGNHWSPINNKQYYIDGQYIDEVIQSYRIENTLNGNGNDLRLSEPKPQAINNKTTETVESHHNVGIEVGGGWSQEEGENAEAKLSYGYGWSNSRTFDTFDVRAEQHSNGVSPGWVYNFKMPEKEPYPLPWIGHLREGAVLGRSTYIPWQTWVWSIPTAQRNTVRDFTLKFTPTFAGVYVHGGGWFDPLVVTTAQEKTQVVTLPTPPLLALENNSIVYDKNAGTQNLRIAAQGGWTSEVTHGGDWITITQSRGRLDVQVDENTTGQSRSGDIRITRNGSSDDTAKIEVTQLR